MSGPSIRPLRVGLVLAPLLAVALSSFLPGPVAGLPVFSRAEGRPCAQCHQGFSALNREGLRFLQAGDRSPDEPRPLRRPSRPIAMSVVADVHEDVVSTDHRGVTGWIADRERPRASAGGDVDLHAAGALGDRTTFHAEAQVPTHHDVVVSDNAFVQADDLLPDGRLNLKVGNYRVQGCYLALSRPERFADLLTAESLPAHGLELNGLGGAWTWGAGLIQSRRTPRGTNLEARALGRLEDPYLWLARDLGGQRVEGRMLFDRQDSNIRRLAWLQHLQAHADARLAAGRVTFVPGYSFDRFDDRPSAGLHQRRQTALLDTRLPLGRAQRWVVTAFAEHDYTTRTVYTPERDHHQEALELGFALRPNTEIALEWSDASDNVAGPRVRQLDTRLRFGY